MVVFCMTVGTEDKIIKEYGLVELSKGNLNGGQVKEKSIQGLNEFINRPLYNISALYLRVSTDDQAKNGYGLDTQLRECCKKVNLGEIVKVYIDDGITGEVLNRPALTQLRADIKEGTIKKVICLDPDRWSRTLKNQLLVTDEIESKAEMEFVNHEYKNTVEGKLFFQMRGAIAEYEKEKINIRMSNGRKEKAKRGLVVRDYEVYGYRYNKDECKMEINSTESTIVQLIFDIFTGKEKIENIKGINGIAKLLTERGVPTKRKVRKWHRQVVRQVLMNRAYIGEFYQNRWNTEGMLLNEYKEAGQDKVRMKERPREEWISVPCPEVIDKEQFEYTQKLLLESRRRFAGTSKRKYLLSGLVRCGECGNTMTGVNYKNWGKDCPLYTDFKSTAGAKNIGCKRRIKVEELDTIVWHEVLKWLAGHGDEVEDRGDTEGQELYEEAELERIEKRLLGLDRERNNLINFIAKKSDCMSQNDQERIRQKLADLNSEEENLNKLKGELQPELESKQQTAQRVNLIRESAEYYLSKAPEEITFDDKQALIRLLVREVRLFENEVKVYGF